MFKTLNFRKKLFIYLSVIFTVFTVLVLLLQYEREREFRKRQLENTLDNITELTHKYIQQKSLNTSKDYRSIDSIATIIPGENIRITIINPVGVVLYDSEKTDYANMENHLHRPEVQLSIPNGYGVNIRISETTGSSYYYYAKYYTDYFVRAAALYNIDIKNFLVAEKVFIFYLLSLFLIIWAILLVFTGKIGRTITNLKDFAIKLSQGNDEIDSLDFPDDELGVISSQIAEFYHELNNAKNEVLVEKNKLHSHMQALNEGIAFFSSKKKKVLTNNHFITFLNLISEESTISAEKIFDIKELKPIIRFIDNQLKNFSPNDPDSLPQMESDLYKNDHYFNIRCIIFQDKSFEIVIKDTSKLERRRLLKQQMTSNIAHELKTPLATVLGYLETLQRNQITKEKQQYFTEKAYDQAKRLSDLIEDISMLSKIEEAKEHFSFETVNILTLVKEVDENLSLKLQESNIKVDIDILNDVEVNGNKSLLFSVFYNLFDNVIKYGGDDVNVNISNYLEDNDYYYFSFANTGAEIDDSHFNRIFERFYRLDTGRSRKTGGTGLGLAIVKNAIKLHSGDIKVRNYKEGGVEFLFTIAK